MNESFKFPLQFLQLYPGAGEVLSPPAVKPIGTVMAGALLAWCEVRLVEIMAGA